MFRDIHTHTPQNNTSEEMSIFNLNIPDHLCCCGLNLRNCSYSLGIHPWKIWPDLLSEQLRFIEENVHFDSVKAVGECGLDKLCDTPFEWQMRAFRGQIGISEKYHKPLIIHCVKATDELLALKKDLKPNQAWIIHGFRGKPEQMRQLTTHGFYLSFGIHFNADTLRETPPDAFFLETDEADVSIRTVYEAAADCRGLFLQNLQDRIEKNFAMIF